MEVPFSWWLREPNGEARGVLLGGCLSLLTATLGTPFAPDLEGALVFWEDLNEPPYKVDRMLTHLRLSGNLDSIAGMIIGQIGNGQEGGSGDWPALIDGSVAGFSWPVGWGLPSGHFAPNWTLPVGLSARLAPLDNESLQLVLGEG
jgi:muramoyltetrapeptide carboxypeptidase